MAISKSKWKIPYNVPVESTLNQQKREKIFTVRLYEQTLNSAVFVCVSIYTCNN